MGKKKTSSSYENLDNAQLRKELRRILSLFITIEEIEEAISDNLGIPSPHVHESEVNESGFRLMRVAVINRYGYVVHCTCKIK